MTRIVFEPDEEQPPARLQEALHRKALLKDAIARLGDVVAQSDANFRSDAEWYVAVLLDGLLRGALVVEFREWTGHCEDLLRDQLSRQGRDPEEWSERRRQAEGAELVELVRQVLHEELDARLPEEVWKGLKELAAVAETIADSTAAARRRLQEAYPGYFTTMDPFGDGDQGMRLTLKQLHLERAFDAVVTFWTPGRGLPYRLCSSVA